MRTDPFAPFIEHHGCVVLDGGLATALEALGYVLDDRLWSAALLWDAPEAIIAVHRAYLDAGADCITTASYQASITGFVNAGYSDREAVDLLGRSSDLALAARDAFASEHEVLGGDADSGAGRGPAAGVGAPRRPAPMPLVAASVGPYGAYLADGSEYDGRYPGVSDADLIAFHRRRLEILAGSGVDLLACETVPSGREVSVLVDLLPVLQVDVPAWISFACRDGARLNDGTPVEEAAAACAAADGVVALGVNCTAPQHVPELVARIATAYQGHVLAYPNSGERYEASTGTWSGDDAPDGKGLDDDWLASVLRSRAAGADILGGCCRVGPEAIGELRRRVTA